jgi:hypothetical protein
MLIQLWLNEIQETILLQKIGFQRNINLHNLKNKYFGMKIFVNKKQTTDFKGKDDERL